MSEQANLDTPENRRLAAKLATPDGYAEYWLGLKLHPKQAAVLRDIFPKTGKSRVSLRKANEIGGTRTIVVAAVLYALDILQADVVSTAGKWLQVSTQLIPALKRFQHLYPTWEFLDSAIKIRGIDRYVGFSTTSGFAQGFHKSEGRPLVGIIDEAGLVDKGIFDDIEDRCNPDFFLCSGAPMEPSGAFYDIETKHAKFYTHHHISQMDCLASSGYWLELSDIERKIAKWGKEHPFLQSNVFGEFAKQIENGLMSLKEFNLCIANPPEHRPEFAVRHAFVDVGRNNIFALRHGNKVTIVKKWWDDSEIGVCGEIIRIASKLKKEIGLTSDEITVDAGGEYGKIVTDELHKMGWYVRKWYGNQAAVDLEYQNSVSEAWIGGASLIKSCDIIIPDNDEFRHQVLTRKKKSHPSGRSQIEPKDEYMKRGFESPHEADAIFGAMMQLASNKSTNLSGFTKQTDERGWIERARDERQSDSVLPAESCL